MSVLRSAIPDLLVGVAALILAWILPTTVAVNELRAGVAFMFESPDRWLAIIGLGLALGSENGEGSWAGWAALVGGACVAIASGHSSVWQWLTGPSTYAYLHLLGPGACLLSGLLLVGKGRWRTRLYPVAAFAVTTMLLLTAAINDPALGGYGFSAGAFLSAAGLALLTSALRRLVAGNWMPIGERIAGSWLLTIGLLLSAVQLLPSPTSVPDIASPAVEASTRPPTVPDFAPAMRPDEDVVPMSFGDRGTLKGTN